MTDARHEQRGGLDPHTAAEVATAIAESAATLREVIAESAATLREVIAVELPELGPWPAAPTPQTS